MFQRRVVALDGEMESNLDKRLRKGRGIVRRLTRLFPHTYADAALVARLPPLGRRHLLFRAALSYARGQAALSHMSALEVWDMHTAAT